MIAPILNSVSEARASTFPIICEARSNMLITALSFGVVPRYDEKIGCSFVSDKSDQKELGTQRLLCLAFSNVKSLLENS